MPHFSSVLLLASHIAFAAAFAPSCAPTRGHDRHLGAWGAGIASALVIAPGRATADMLAAPKSAADFVPASLTTDSLEAAAEKIRAGIGTRKPVLRMQGGGGQTQWTLLRDTFRGKWTAPTTWFGKV
ncbi:hypothetical protein T484DRAFT_1813033 [Baffinella frigidus]|nr:hypothetical protein T484DRAFT_1813033 [Cryptophyta sp. CCMP2293]